MSLSLFRYFIKEFPFRRNPFMYFIVVKDTLFDQREPLDRICRAIQPVPAPYVRVVQDISRDLSARNCPLNLSARE